MPGLNLYTSNRLENLAQQLAAAVRTPASSPLVPGTVVVQSRGMERWICLQLASLNTICANVQFPFPNAFFNDLFGRLFPDMGAAAPYDPDVLVWHIMELLPEMCQKSAFERLALYLDDDYGQRKQYQLAAKIADTFDQYIVFRPEMMAAWESGRADHWQAKLWRALFTRCGPIHRDRLRHKLFERLKNDQTIGKHLPERLSIFGVSYLPPFYLQMFAALAHRIDVHLFVMNPCRQYWADIVSDREIQFISDAYADDGYHHAELHLEKGNRLLASLGQVGRHFFGLVNEFEGRQFEDFHPPIGNSLLADIQRDILDLTEGQPGRQMPSDRSANFSIQIHSCHNAMREIEVLHDRLLAMFEADPQLKPEDIMVMTPDVEVYAPYIHAVFSQVETDSDRIRIPYSVADQSLRKEGRIVETWLALLDLYKSRYEASKVMGLLESPAVLTRFEMTERDLTSINRWVEETQIRWGRDDSDIKQPLDSGINTWTRGMERLILGYAMPMSAKRLFVGRLPSCTIEGQQAQVLGRFLSFLESLFEMVQKLGKSRPVSVWKRLLSETIDRFFGDNQNFGREIELVRKVIDRMEQTAIQAGYGREIGFEVVRNYLDLHLGGQGFGSGFLAGGVTFGTLLPMRSIPFKVVCLLGMNDDAFPRETRRPGFDFLSRYPKPGDRSRRADDKYMFLEAILSARQIFYISYVGQSAQDNAPLPPSVVVRELIDYMSDAYQIKTDDLVMRHRLQAFSPAYFQNDRNRLFSYSRENCEAATGMSAASRITPFIEKTLPLGPDQAVAFKNLGIEVLGEFFANPSRFFLKNRLGVDLSDTLSMTLDRENFDLDGLQRYLLGSELARLSRKGDTLKDQLKNQLMDQLNLHRAGGLLPHANVGETLFRNLSSEADQFSARFTQLISGEPLPPCKVDLDLDGFSISGHLDNRYSQGGVFLHYATMKAKYILNTWCYHLFCCAVHEQQKIIPETFLFCKDQGLRFDAVADAPMMLGRLLNYYLEGLSSPLPFFADSAHGFADAVLNRGKSSAVALDMARRIWLGNYFVEGESADPYIQRCFGGLDDVLDPDFIRLAVDIFKPIFNHYKLLW